MQVLNGNLRAEFDIGPFQLGVHIYIKIMKSEYACFHITSDVIPVPQNVSANITTCNSLNGTFDIVVSWQWPFNLSICEGNGIANQVGMHLKELSTSATVALTSIRTSTTRWNVQCRSYNLNCGSFYRMSMQLNMTAVIILGGKALPNFCVTF